MSLGLQSRAVLSATENRKPWTSDFFEAVTLTAPAACVLEISVSKGLPLLLDFGLGTSEFIFVGYFLLILIFIFIKLIK